MIVGSGQKYNIFLGECVSFKSLMIQRTRKLAILYIFLLLYRLLICFDQFEIGKVSYNRFFSQNFDFFENFTFKFNFKCVAKFRLFVQKHIFLKISNFSQNFQIGLNIFICISIFDYHFEISTFSWITDISFDICSSLTLAFVEVNVTSKFVFIIWSNWENYSLHFFCMSDFFNQPLYIIQALNCIGNMVSNIMQKNEWSSQVHWKQFTFSTECWDRHFFHSKIDWNLFSKILFLFIQIILFLRN